MGPTARNKIVAATAAGILTAGFAVVIRSAALHNPAGSIGGACLIMTGLTLMILIFVRRWVCETSAERRALAQAQRDAQDERSRYIALKAALEGEHGRLVRDVAAERAGIAATLRADRAKLEAEFRENRATELSEAFRTGVEMERAGMLKRRQPQRGNLLTFPGRQPETQMPERSREHGVAGP